MFQVYRWSIAQLLSWNHLSSSYHLNMDKDYRNPMDVLYVGKMGQYRSFLAIACYYISGSHEKNRTSVTRLSVVGSTIELHENKTIIKHTKKNTLNNCAWAFPKLPILLLLLPPAISYQDSANLSMFNVGSRFSLPIPRSAKNKKPRVFSPGSV